MNIWWLFILAFNASLSINDSGINYCVREIEAFAKITALYIELRKHLHMTVEQWSP